MNNNLTNEEIEDLRIFLEQVESLKNSQFLRFTSENGVGLKWKISRTEGASITYTFPNDEFIKSFVVDFSQIFLTDKQPANFHHICNILQKWLPDGELKQQSITCRRQYNQMANEGVIGVVLNGKTFAPKEAINDWLMAYYRHNSKEKRAKIAIWQNAGGDFYKFHFVNSLVELTKPILMLSLIIKSAINKND